MALTNEDLNGPKTRARTQRIYKENMRLEEATNAQQAIEKRSKRHLINFETDFGDIKWLVTFDKETSPKTYLLAKLLYRSTSINGRATLCWEGQQVIGNKLQRDAVVIKLSHQDKGRESEQSLIGSHGPNCDTSVSKYISQILCSIDIEHQPFIGKRCIDPTADNLEISDTNGWHKVAEHKDYQVAAETFKFHERICHIQVVTPRGYPLVNARSYEEATRAIRDAVVGYQHTLNVHKVIHRDVSIGNIMIGVDEDGSTFGFLTDFDLAKRHESPGFAVAKHRSGTVPYMSIPVLENCLWHTSRDDAESFFRVLLHISDLEFDSDLDSAKSLDRSVDASLPIPIEKCWNMPLLELADHRRDKMSPAIFESSLGGLKCAEYDEIRTLLVELHKIIFPNGTIILGDFKDPIHHSKCDFDQMIKAFNKCLKALETRWFSQQ